MNEDCGRPGVGGMPQHADGGFGDHEVAIAQQVFEQAVYFAKAASTENPERGNSGRGGLSRRTRSRDKLLEWHAPG